MNASFMVQRLSRPRCRSQFWDLGRPLRGAVVKVKAGLGALQREQFEIGRRLRRPVYTLAPRADGAAAADGEEIYELRKRLAVVEKERTELSDKIKTLLEAKPEVQQRQVQWNADLARRKTIARERYELQRKERELAAKIKELEEAQRKAEAADAAGDEAQADETLEQETPR